MKKHPLPMVLTLLLFLTGCIEIPNHKVSQIKLSTSQDKTILLEKSKPMDIVMTAIERSSKIQGQIDISSPDIRARLRFKNGVEKIYFIWISKSRGLVMDPKETGTGYDMRKPDAKALNELVEIKFNKSND